GNGWAITPRRADVSPDVRNGEEANDLLDILEFEVMPLYYKHEGRGYSADWVRLSKASMKSILPQFNALRMVMDYVRKFYGPAAPGCADLRSTTPATRADPPHGKTTCVCAGPSYRFGWRHNLHSGPFIANRWRCS